MESERLTQEDYRRVAERLKVEVAAVMAVKVVETGGRKGFIGPGRPVILFEGHVFWRELVALGYHPEEFAEGYEDILYPKWTKEHYKGGGGEYERLEKAFGLAEKIGKTPEKVRAIQEAALKSKSTGLFQIMGFNYRLCGFRDVWEGEEAMKRSEGAQLDAFAAFIESNPKLLDALRKKDWPAVARIYNGPAYAKNQYDVKLAQNYEKYKEA